jgi:molybdenum ABC transporter molybdate-binding protein
MRAAGVARAIMRERTESMHVRNRALSSYAIISGMIAVAAVLVLLMARNTGSRGPTGRKLMLFCAAGMRAPVEAILAEYEKDTGVRVQTQYGGSNTLLSQIQISAAADLFLAADDSYIEIALKKGLIRETIPLATVKPVIIVQPGNPKGIRKLSDLLVENVRVALGSPDQGAIGMRTKEALVKSGDWPALEARVTRTGVFKPTVTDVANTVRIGAVDAGIVWSATAFQYPELGVVTTPELDLVRGTVSIGVTAATRDPPTAIGLARYIAGSNRGLPVFSRTGYEVVEGDPWTPRPEITFFAGSVTRRALDPIIRRFERREGVLVNTVYNGCGILTAQMRAIGDGKGFPDTYIACDQYYLDTVSNLFEQGIQVSDTPIVMAVAKGNPREIRTLSDLARPGIRVAVGQPDQCTIGILTRRLLADSGLYGTVLTNNVVTQTATSAMLVPAVTTRAADVALAYRTDTLAETARVDAIAIDSPLAMAVQPFAIARSTEYRQLSRRLLDTLKESGADFESAGFNWHLDRRQPGTETPIHGR